MKGFLQAMTRVGPKEEQEAPSLKRKITEGGTVARLDTGLELSLQSEPKLLTQINPQTSPKSQH